MTEIVAAHLERVAKERRRCQRCGRGIRKGEHPNVIYCSPRCSMRTVEEFEGGRALERAAGEKALPTVEAVDLKGEKI